MTDFASQMARRVEPYTPGEQPQDKRYIKLNTNECPYPPSPKVSSELAHTEDLRLYPDPTCRLLRQAVSQVYGLEPDQVFIGNGSDEVLAFSFMAFGSQDLPITPAAISYSFYPVWARLLDIPYRVHALKDDLSLPLEEIAEDGNGPMVICNPNAPTGLALPCQKLEEVLKGHPDRLMIVDEAYVDFGAQSMVPMIGRYPNLLVIQTFSKSRALAGARVGFAMGQKDLIDYLNRVKNSFNSYTISRFSLEAARAAMLDTDYFSDITGRITATRERVKKELWAHGFDLTDSKTNFLWVRSDKIGGQELYEALKEQGILVRHFSDPAITDRIRVTIGTDQQMDVFLKTLFSITEKETTCVKQ